MKDRESWIDTAKGIGIITVVIGHSENDFNNYLYWFHMPLFFIISGYLHKPLGNITEFKQKTIRKTSQFLLPYFSFGLIVSILLLAFTLNPTNFIKDIVRLIYGGELLAGYFNVFWFITVLLLTNVLFTLLQIKTPIKTQVALITFFYMLAQVISHIDFLKNLQIPWNADVVLISITYYAIGFYSRPIIKLLISKFLPLVTTAILSIVLITLEKKNFVNYSIDMKKNLYNHPILDLLIPIIFSCLVLFLSYRLSLIFKNGFLAYLGTISLSIMYLHMPVNKLIEDVLDVQFVWILSTLIGILVPSLIHKYILIKFFFTRKWFLGIQGNPKTQIEIKKLTS